MLKNLIIIPLESVSNLILWQYRIELPTVWWLMEQSFSYTRFYGASVSTESALMDLWNGCSDTCDGLSLYKERYDLNHSWRRNNPKRTTLHTLAHFAGYERFSLIEEYLAPPVKKDLWMTDCNVDNLFSEARSRLAGAKAKNKPIMLMFRMVISHMAFDDRVKGRAETFSERFRLGYMQLDRAVNRFLSILEELNMLNDSVIVCFGDHGDELWSHGLNKGYCHGTTPYASLNWTPLFIHDSSRPPGTSDRVVSMIDLRESLTKLLVPGCDPAAYGKGSWTLPPFRQTPYDGIDAFAEKRELAFAQNLFAMQLEYSDLERGLFKGYSVTDGAYRAVVSSGGSNPKKGGMEFFCERVDPANTRNLLDFFTLAANGDIGKFSPPPGATDRGFVLAFNDRAVAHLTETYAKLKTALYAYVRGKEARAAQFNSGPCHVMPESVFRHARKRLARD